MPRITRGKHTSYKPVLFSWLQRQLILVEDWPYSDTCFRGHSDMLLLEVEDYEDGGKNKQFIYLFIYFLIF